MTAYSDLRWTSADGLTLHARDYAPAEPSGKAPVVCLHGLTRNAADFGDLAPRIAALGRRVMAADVRGRGLSDWSPDPMTYVVPVYVGDVLALLADQGIERAVFIGTSMGGLITMVAASVKPEAVAAAVLNDIGPQIAPAGLARIAAYAGARRGEINNLEEAAAYAKAINAAAYPDYDDADWLRFASNVIQSAPGGGLRLAYDPDIAVPIRAADPKAPPPDLWPLFRALTEGRPTLLVRGALSDLLDEPIAEAMRQAAPDMAYAEVPRVGHAPNLGEPAAWAAIEALLAKAP